ncbi:hypothetical protein GCM10025782_11510 [Pedococcus ginsenosidimutans]|uniref:Uncharacterized protein n=1 Tax=Pedococcus ginsenosidimutans TaxID=490570 RepID=A0ABP8XYF7_9MICO
MRELAATGWVAITTLCGGSASLPKFDPLVTDTPPSCSAAVVPRAARTNS